MVTPTTQTTSKLTRQTCIPTSFGTQNPPTQNSVSRAIQAATSLNARAFGIADLVGSLTPGKFADILVVRGDPSRSISDIRNVRAVFKGGSEVYAPPVVATEPRKA